VLRKHQMARENVCEVVKGAAAKLPEMLHLGHAMALKPEAPHVEVVTAQVRPQLIEPRKAVPGSLNGSPKVQIADLCDLSHEFKARGNEVLSGRCTAAVRVVKDHRTYRGRGHGFDRAGVTMRI
jgi:hypothetical protein